jgi:hypothetical protein
MWKSSHIWEWLNQIKIAFIKTLQADEIQGTFVSIQFRIFVVLYKKQKDKNSTNYNFSTFHITFRKINNLCIYTYLLSLLISEAQTVMGRWMETVKYYMSKYS